MSIAEPAKPVSQLVRALLERHAVPRRRHVSFVGEFLQLSRAAAHQRVTGSNAWTLEELRALAQHFGEELADVVSGVNDSRQRGATLRVGALRLPCQVWLADVVEGMPTDALVAVRQGEGYAVVPSTAALGRQCWNIEKLEVGRSPAAAQSVAVYGTEPEVCQQMCAQLRSEGFEANAYADPDDLLADAERGLYEGYVVDWSTTGGPMIIPVLAAIRGQERRAALVLLSGGTRTGLTDASEVAAAAARFAAPIVEKPVQTAFLMAALIAQGLAPVP